MPSTSWAPHMKAPLVPLPVYDIFPLLSARNKTRDALVEPINLDKLNLYHPPPTFVIVPDDIVPAVKSKLPSVAGCPPVSFNLNLPFVRVFALMYILPVYVVFAIAVIDAVIKCKPFDISSIKLSAVNVPFGAVVVFAVIVAFVFVQATSENISDHVNKL